MKIAVIGAGALGTLFGGWLANAGEEVWLLHHRQAFVDEVGETVTIEHDGSSVQAPVHATTDATTVGQVDLVLVLVKAHQTREALQQHERILGPESVVLTLQNGLQSYDILRETVAPEQALGGITYQGAELTAPGSVIQTTGGRTVFGGDNREAAALIASTFEAADLGPIEVVHDPRSIIWEKQLVSLAFKPISALTRLPVGDIVADELLLAIIEDVLAEAEAVAASRGISVDAESAYEEVIDIGEANPDHRSSMLQDVEANRKTELEAITGAIVEYGQTEGIAVPRHETLYALVRGLEYGYLSE